MPDAIVVDKSKCPRCGSETVISDIREQLGFSVKPMSKTGKLFSPVSGVEAYVCKQCGHIELFAIRLDVFQKL